jgi:hypothetical protein
MLPAITYGATYEVLPELTLLVEQRNESFFFQHFPETTVIFTFLLSLSPFQIFASNSFVF